ncbi:MAG TPA: M56 family metallopeptidase, partial [Candidatus Binatia bacterium]|nr:M56 family metallopeptidase [Candidatus Binatia bacterium]
MSTIEFIASGVLGWLWQTSVAAMVLVAVVLLIQLSCRRWLPARWTYILWLLVAARLILPVAPESSFSLSNLYTGIPKRRAELPPRATPLLVVPTAISPVPAPAKPATRF